MNDTELEINLQPYKLDVAQLGNIGLTRRTTHPSGGAAAIKDVGSWDRVQEVARGGSGAVFLESNMVTGVLRAVKQLTWGSESEQLREINIMLFVKEVSCNEAFTAYVLLTGAVRGAVCRISCLVRAWGFEVHFDGVRARWRSDGLCS